MADEDSFERNVYWLNREVSLLRGDLTVGQLKDQSIVNAIRQLREQGEIMSGPFKKQEGMRIDELGRLFRKRALVVSRNQRAEVTELAHRVTHSGVEKTCAYLRDRFYWVGMRKDVEQCCRTCIVFGEQESDKEKRTVEADHFGYRGTEKSYCSRYCCPTLWRGRIPINVDYH